MHRAASAPAAQATRARSRYASRRLTRSLPPPRTRTSFSRFSRLRAHAGEAFFLSSTLTRGREKPNRVSKRFFVLGEIRDDVQTFRRLGQGVASYILTIARVSNTSLTRAVRLFFFQKFHTTFKHSQRVQRRFAARVQGAAARDR